MIPDRPARTTGAIRLKTSMRRTLFLSLVLIASFIGTAKVYAQAQMNLICAPGSDWCEAIVAGFQRDTGIKVNMVRKSSGEILAQLRAEAQNPKFDLWFGGSTDTHFVAAEQGLLQPYASPNMANLHAWALKAHAQSNQNCVGVSSAAIAISWNTEVLKKKNVSPPTNWDDLLAPRFKGEVQLLNPNSSGTAYTIIAGWVQMWGEDKAFDFMKALHVNVNSYARSGGAPIKAVANGETGVTINFDLGALTERFAGYPVEMIYPPQGTSYEVACMAIIKGARHEAQARQFYDWYLTPRAMDIGPAVNQWFVPAHKGAAPNPKLPDPAKIKLIDYDFATYGSAATRKKLLDRWDREIGALPASR